jgi:hypothetical protein
MQALLYPGFLIVRYMPSTFASGRANQIGGTLTGLTTQIACPQEIFLRAEYLALLCDNVYFLLLITCQEAIFCFCSNRIEGICCESFVGSIVLDSGISHAEFGHESSEFFVGFLNFGR